MELDILSKIAELEQEIRILEARVSGLESQTSDASMDGNDGFIKPEDILMDGGGGGGTFMGNTDDSEEIDGDVTFESADDSNVEVTTEKRTEGDEEVNVIKIGVYYI